jgi:hypothetical protein
VCPVVSEALAAKSATLSPPVPFHHTAERPALGEIARESFEPLRTGGDPDG